MPDARFKSKSGRCKMCNKICYDTEHDAALIINWSQDIGLRSAYRCSLYPDSYWHTTKSKWTGGYGNWEKAINKKAGSKKRAKRLIQKVKDILRNPPVAEG